MTTLEEQKRTIKPWNEYFMNMAKAFLKIRKKLWSGTKNLQMQAMKMLRKNLKH